MVSEGGPTLPDGPAVLDRPDPARVRDELVELVLRDLHGPLDGPEEDFDADPVERYPLGRLAPAGTVVEPETLDDIAEAESPDPAEGDPEPTGPNVASLFPSAIGLTARVAAGVGELVVTAEWGRYERVASDSPVGPPRVWRRVPMCGRAVVRLAEGLLPAVPLSPDQPGVVVRGRARRHADTWLVSLFLVNAQHGEHTAKSAWLFQTSLSVTGPEPAASTHDQDRTARPAAVFLPRDETVSGGDASDRAEQRRLAMAYRFHPEFAVGHATAVHPETDPGDPMRAWRVSTVAAPRYELPATDTPDPVRDPDLSELADVVVDMARLAELADGPPDTLTAALTPLVRGYRHWIEAQAATANEPGRHLAGYQDEATDALEAARRAARRIESGIAVLASDPRARRAFGFANRAMALQRVHTMAAERRRKDPELGLDVVLAEIDRPENRSWRPFQLAFILLNLPSLADPRHPERDVDQARAVADLLWFPTGGGKTEAYLGLTAFTLAARRLSPPLGGLNPAGGVGVLMRYTLRLLTIQQFQRAATLICAAEALRRDDAATWGDTPFRLGLWVGGQVTPNRTDVAADWESDIRRGRGRGAGRSSPHQLTSCPWCGTAIDAGRDITVNKTRRRTLVVCPDVFCPFGAGSADREGLPVVVVDEEIYRLLPGLVIATVDKFAQLPWKGETSALFGRVTGRCERHGYITDDLLGTDWEATSHPARNGEPAARLVPAGALRPPDLIIQDELHLISGPLGSLTGLYEAAVDRLCTWEPERGSPVRPKVIASTATVRRAPHQIGALFHRRTEVFPPPGLDASDSFFARQRPTTGPGAAPGRLYVGICSHGVRTKSTLIRAYVSVLGAAQRLHEKYGANEITDPYMTLVGYFNSLRELGGMRRLVEDDVTTRLARADQRGLSRRYDPMLAELTSRLSSADIPKILDHLAVPFAPRVAGQRRPLDVLLA
ncbi:MAG TPA: DISARM system helicase DrmA, partial [Mycobacteriales bacterium]